MISGIIPVLPTPFRQDGAVDRAAMRRALDFVSSAGAQGVVFPGFASEVADLSAEERFELLEVVAISVPSDVQVIAGASADDTDSVIEYGRQAERLGIRLMMVQPPTALGGDAATVAGFLARVVDANPNMMLILQNAPAPRGCGLTPDAILEIAHAVPAVEYVKEETLPAGPAMTRILERRPATLAGVIGGGGARYVLDEFARGACAAMPAAEITDLHVTMDRAWRDGRTDEARALYIRTLPLLALQAVYRMRLTKHVLERRGILSNSIVRAPTPQLDEWAIADIEQNLRELDLIPVDQPLQATAS